MKALFIPYAVALKSENKLFWQRNLGSYLDKISRLFDKTTIVCQTADENNKTYSTNKKPIYSYEMDSNNIEVKSFSNLDAPSNISSKLKLLEKEVADADFIYLFLPSFKALFAARMAIKAKKPYAIYIGSDWNDVAQFIIPPSVPGIFRPTIKQLVRSAERRAVKHAAFTLVHGKQVIDRYNGEQNRVFETVPIMNWGLDDFFTRPDTCIKDPINCIFVGTISERKGTRTLLEGIAQAKAEGLQIKLSIIGKGRQKAEDDLRKQIQELNIQENTSLKGYISNPNDLLKLYQESDVFILPTLGEGFPRVIYEAMSQSLPVITTNTGSIPNILTHKKDVLLINPNSPKEISNALKIIKNDLTLRKQIIQKGIELAKTKFTNNAEQQFKQIFEKYTS